MKKCENCINFKLDRFDRGHCPYVADKEMPYPSDETDCSCFEEEEEE